MAREQLSDDHVERDKYGIIIRYRENGFRDYTDEELVIYNGKRN
jgi:hypothetical protein